MRAARARGAFAMPSYNELNDEDPRARVTVGDEVLFGAREGVIVRDDEDNEPYQVKLRDGYQTTDFLIYVDVME